MSAIKYAIDKIKLEIPRDILNLVFLKKSETFNITTSIDEQITTKVIDQIVLADMNLIDGMTMIIPVANCGVTEHVLTPTDYNNVIYVPYELTQDKKIITALSVTSAYEYNSIYNSSKNMMLSMASNILQHTSHVVEGEVYSELELIGPNTILVHNDVVSLANAYLTVIVENDRNLNNIKPTTYRMFGKMAVRAAKAYIYNELVISLDKGALYYGHELSRIGEIIDSYSEDLEEYNILLNEKWPKIAFMNDGVKYSRYINSITGNNI